jgi:hypothetical protein
MTLRPMAILAARAGGRRQREVLGVGAPGRAVPRRRCHVAVPLRCEQPL